jgi:hypothetical protein
MVQLYSGVKRLLCKAFLTHISSKMPGTLEAFTRSCGAPNALFSDNAPEQCSKQNNDVKRTTNLIMDRTGTQEKYWLLCLLFVIYVFNRLSTESIGGQVPLTVAYGGPTDYSALLNYSWFEDVLYTTEGSYPSAG